MQNEESGGKYGPSWWDAGQALDRIYRLTDGSVRMEICVLTSVAGTRYWYVRIVSLNSPWILSGANYGGGANGSKTMSAAVYLCALKAETALDKLAESGRWQPYTVLPASVVEARA